MSEIDRNGPCPCGSGRKAKNCCHRPEVPRGAVLVTIPASGGEPARRVAAAEATALAQRRHAQGDGASARRLYELVLAADPGHADALSYLGLLHHQMGDHAQGTALMRRASDLRPGDATLAYNLGKAHQTMGELSAAIEMYRRALAAQPRHAAAHCNLGNALQQMGDLRGALEQFERGMAACPDHAVLRSSHLCALNYLPRPDLPAIFAAHRKFAEIFEAPLRPTSPRPAPADADAARPLRVGYVSADFRRHSVAHFIEPVLAAHDRAAVEPFCYFNHRVADDATRRIRALVPHWREIADRSDDEVAAQIRADRIDILVDLAGHTPDHRLLVFARRPAPVQATWLGYPNTTGLSSMDWRLTDAVADPPGMTESLHSERLMRLPDGFSCYMAPAQAPAVAPPPMSAAGRVTFGSFNNAMKITDEMIAAWAGVLRRVPASRLLLKYLGLDSADMKARLHGAFARHGVSADRVPILGMDADQLDHLGRYGEIDVALDPFPYNGTTTTLDALWMGVPVVTLAGRSHVARVGASQLTHLGLPEFVARDEAEYADVAVRAAGDAPRLASLRSGLRERLRASPLMDSRGFTRRLEAAYRSMWSDALRATSPDTRPRDDG